VKVRAFIYGRYSTDRQNDKSVDDQFALCRPYCDRKGYEIVGVFGDRAKSGASAVNRPDYRRMVAAAIDSKCDVIVAEDLDRLSRNQADIARLYEKMNFAEVAIETVADGLINEMHIGLKGTMNALFLKNLVLKIRRGQAGSIRAGKHAGGLSYGYRPVPGKPGERQIVPEHAEIVRRIFREYVAGETERAICARLNAEGAPPPRKSHWRPATLHGHSKRKTGILQNELYAGRLIWNRVGMVKNPDTGKRLSRPRPESDWQRTSVPHLRIVDQKIFDLAQAERAKRAHGPVQWRRRPKRILSGLLRCGLCGGGMSKKDTAAARPRIICTRMHDSAICDNRRSYYLDEIEREVIGGLRRSLGTPAAIKYFMQCYNEERKRKAAGASDRRQMIETELAEIERQIERAVAALIVGRITEEEAAAHLPRLRLRRTELAEHIAANGHAKAVTLHIGAVGSFIRDLGRLESVINGDLAADASAAAGVIRSMIETVTILPTPAGMPGIIARGSLNRLLDPGLFRDGIYLGGDVGSGGRI
jgi:site-specific DNA recombinase